MTLRADNEARSTVDVMTEFLAAIFEGTQEPKFFQTLANDAGDADEAPNKKSILTDQVASIERFVARHDRNRRGTFFCVATIANQSPTRNKDNCREITVAHTDLDFRSISEDEPAIRKVVDTLPIPPSIVVFSGGGLHLYWLLKEPLPAQEYRERIEALNRKLASVLAGDLQATDVCRLMRLPGTTNSKYGSQRKVVVEKLDAAFRYDFDDLEEAVAGLRPLLTVKSQVGIVGVPRHAQKSAAPKTPDNPFLKVAEEQGWKPPLDVEQALASMTYPGNVHDIQIRVAASLAKAGVERDDVIDTVLEATMNAPGVDVAKWDLRAEEKKIGGAYDSAVAKFGAPVNVQANGPAAGVSRETPKTTASVAGKGAGIGAAEVGNVVPFSTGKKRKAANAQATHIVLADTVRTVLEDEGHRLKFTEQGSYVYEAGLWCLRDDRSLKAWLDAVIERGARGLKLESKIRLISEARAYLIRSPDLQHANPPFDQHGKVPTLSGLVDPVTGEIEPAAPEHYCTWRIPYEYAPASACPNWLQMLADAFADRPPAVQAQYIQLIQEALGMGLVDKRAKALSRAVIFQGGSNTGKSDTIDVMAGLFGDRVNTTPLDDLDKSHGTMAFVQRVPWVLHEAFDQGKWHLAATVKSIVSLEKIRINMKGGRIFDHRPTGPVFWGTNPVPQFKEATEAITNRILIIECRHRFDEDVPVGVAITARTAGYRRPSELVLGTEMAGVLAWAFAGLQRAQARGYFLIPDESRAAAEAVRRDSNIVAGFMDCVTLDPESMVSVADFTAAVAAWWRDTKGTDRGSPSNDSVGKALRALSDPRIGLDLALRDMHRRYIAGVRLNDEGKRYWGHTVNSNTFEDNAKKASTSLPEEDPNRLIPILWDSKPAIEAMRVAQSKSMTRGSMTPVGDFPYDTSPPMTHDTVEDIRDTF